MRIHRYAYLAYTSHNCQCHKITCESVERSPVRPALLVWFVYVLFGKIRFTECAAIRIRSF